MACVFFFKRKSAEILIILLRDFAVVNVGRNLSCFVGELEKTEGMKPHVLLDSLKACGFQGEHRLRVTTGVDPWFRLFWHTVFFFKRCGTRLLGMLQRNNHPISSRFLSEQIFWLSIPLKMFNNSMSLEAWVVLIFIKMDKGLRCSWYLPCWGCVHHTHYSGSIFVDRRWLPSIRSLRRSEWVQMVTDVAVVVVMAAAAVVVVIVLQGAGRFQSLNPLYIINQNHRHAHYCFVWYEVISILDSDQNRFTSSFHDNCFREPLYGCFRK